MSVFNDANVLDDMNDALAMMKYQKQCESPIVRRIMKNFPNPKLFQESIGVEFRRSKRDLGTAAWDVLSAFMAYLKGNHITKNLVAYGECICELVKSSSPKEVYIGVLEQYDPATDFRYIEMLNPALKLIIMKYVESEPNSCAVSFETTLSTMLCYFESFNKPNFDNFDPERPLDKVYENLKCLKYTERSLNIVKPAVTTLLARSNEIRKLQRFKSFCLQYSCHLTMMLLRLDTDVAAVKDVSENDENAVENAPTHFVVHELIDLALQLYSMPFLFSTTDWVSLHPPDSFVSPESLPEIGRQIFHGKASFLYFVLCRGIRYDQFPKVYSPFGLWCKSIYPINALLMWESPIVLWKGLELLSTIVDRTVKSSINCEELLYHISLDYRVKGFVAKPKSAVRTLLKELGDIALKCNVIAICRKACYLLTRVIDLFTWRDKILLLTFVFKSFIDCRVEGFVIGFLKDKLDEVLRDDAAPGSEVFCHQRRMKMVGGLIFHLPDGTDTDLLGESDKIMQALNLLRFLLLRDKDNRTGLFDNLSLIQTNYVQAIRFNVEVTRQHFESELLANYEKRKQLSPAKSDIVINSHKLNDFSREDRAKTLQAAIHTLSMMEVVTVRVDELIDEMAKKNSANRY